MPWEETDVMDQRVKFVAQALWKRVNFTQLCAGFGVSRPTGYRWRERYREVGSFALLAEKSRRPHSSPERTPAEVEARVVAARRRYGWGARKLRVVLLDEGLDVKVWTINRIIARNALIAEAASHRPATGRFERKLPNELWQMDFKGEYPVGRGYCYPLSLLDDHSRYAVGLYGLSNQRGKGVHRCVVETFRRSGVPQAMLVDHGTPWWSTTNGHGLTWVSVALIKQGIHLYVSGVRHPQTQGKVERFHRTLAEAVRHQGKPGCLGDWGQFCAEFCAEYNHLRPHEALGMGVPAGRYHPSARAYDPHPPAWEYAAGVVVKQLNTQGCLDYRQRRYFVCEALAGEWVGMEEVDDKLLVSYRHMYIREIELGLGRTRALVLPKPSP